MSSDFRLFVARTLDLIRRWPPVHARVHRTALLLIKTRWGEREWIVPGLGSSSRNIQGYTEGKNAGKIEIVASNAVLDGALRGAVTVGEYQRDAATMPKSGSSRGGSPGIKWPFSSERRWAVGGSAGSAIA